MQLAIDTATDLASVALVDGQRLLFELTWRCEQNHSRELLPSLNNLFRQHGLKWETVSGIIAALGPGSYNGLRVGVSTAKGLAFSLGVPVVGISSLEVAAYQHAATGLPVCAVFNAGREEVAAAIYQKKRGRWQQLVAEHITTFDALCTRITGRTVFAGDFAGALADLLKQRLGRKAVIPPVAGLVRRAAFLAELGQARLAGGGDDLATLQPLYLRRPAITRRRHR